MIIITGGSLSNSCAEGRGCLRGNATIVIPAACRTALDDLIELAKGKTPSYTETPLGDRPVVQDRIARARALIEAGQHYVYGAAAEAWATISD